MPCLHLSDNIVVCSPLRVHRRRILHCPTENRRRRFVVSYEAWYDSTFMCCGCGDSWSGEWRLERPFARGWRDKAIRLHRRFYEAATSGPPPGFDFFFGERAA